MTTIGVCGYGRCGSTMVMEMLYAGGLRPVDGSAEISHELPDLGCLDELDRSVLDGRSVKCLDGFMHFGLPDADWSFIWVDRDPVQQAQSMVKFMRWQMDGWTPEACAVPIFAESFERDRPEALSYLRERGPVLVLQYERVLVNPMKAAKGLARVWAGLDVYAAASAVHSRGPECQPGLTFELTGVPA